MKDKERIVDVSYTDAIKVITNELDDSKLYYSISQASKLLGVETTKLRYWTNFFAKQTDIDEDLIKVAYSNKNRAYTLENINCFKRIKELVEEDGMTLQQAKDYTTRCGFDSKNKTLDSDNPLALTAFVRELTSELNSQMDRKLQNFQESLLQQVTQVIESTNNKLIQDNNNRNEILKEEINILINQTVSENLNEYSLEINSTLEDQQKNIIDKIDKSNQENEEAEKIFKYFESLEKKSTEQTKIINESLAIQKEESKRQIELFDNLRSKMDEKKKEYEAEKNKSFFSKLFNK